MARRRKEASLSFGEEFAIGAVAATLSKTLAAPAERLKLLMQTQNVLLLQGRLISPYRGVIDCYKRTVAAEGLLSLWRGNLASILRFFPSQGILFASREQYLALARASRKGETWISRTATSFIAGGFAGATQLLVEYPLDLARTRLACDNVLTSRNMPRQYDGLLDVFRKVFRSDGIRGLYRGFFISVIGYSIFRGFYLGLFDSLKGFLPRENSLHYYPAAFSLGFFVTMTATLVAYPFDTIRRQLMLSSSAGRPFLSSWDCGWRVRCRVRRRCSLFQTTGIYLAGHSPQIARNEGPRGFYRGITMNVSKGILGAAVLMLFDPLKHWYAMQRRVD